MTTTSKRARVRAPELVGRGGWVSTGGRDLSLAALRGKIVLLDFWTFCCVNCLHVLDELRELEDAYRDVLVVVGVHSPKFVHEADHNALVAAVERYEVHHPVLDDPDLTTWNAYAVRAWPTLTVVDPEGYVVAQMSGEGHAHALGRLLDELVEEHERRATLHRGDGPYVPPPPATTALRFPGKAVRLPSGTYLVSDTKHHGVVEVADDLETVVRRIGNGARALTDGPPQEASFSEPQGLCLLPEDVAARAGYDIVVADTVNHALRGLRLSDGHVRTVAGTGRQWMQGGATSGAAREVDLSSPWDVAWYDGAVVVAMAGIHQLWSFDPLAGTVTVLAGTTNEGLKDGPLREAWFAQTSGLAASEDGSALWVADSETSSLRVVRDGVVKTVTGKGLFDFGHVDGPAADALLQHPLGVTVLPDGSVAVCDTYNGAVRRYDPARAEVTTLAAGLAEPSDAVVLGNVLVIVESAAHRLTAVPIPDAAARVDGLAHRTQRPVTEVAPGPLELEVVFTPPPGQKLDERYGAATRLLVSATPPALLRSGDGRDTDLRRTLELDPAVGDGVLHVAAMAASCDGDPSAEFPACHVHQQDWGVPVRLVEGAPSRLALVLRGMDEAAATSD
ncbi:MAG: NHL domain-containing thioredoxin family protein [Actinomycetota bacterium]|nr:NHL domain-containing thioredoxin family protein [Actinomycetota bacterium]